MASQSAKHLLTFVVGLENDSIKKEIDKSTLDGCITHMTVLLEYFITCLLRVY